MRSRTLVLLHVPVYLLALIGFLVLGRIATRTFIPHYGDLGGDMAKQTVARSALMLIHVTYDNPIERSLIAKVRVVDVSLEPAHCEDYPPAAADEHRDYVARVRLYTIYGIPIRTHTVTCGGWRWSRH
jgi:hypothetical protein